MLDFYRKLNFFPFLPCASMLKVFFVALFFRVAFFPPRQLVNEKLHTWEISCNISRNKKLFSSPLLGAFCLLLSVKSVFLLPPPSRVGRVVAVDGESITRNVKATWEQLHRDPQKWPIRLLWKALWQRICVEKCFSNLIRNNRRGAETLRKACRVSPLIKFYDTKFLAKSSISIEKSLNVKQGKGEDEDPLEPENFNFRPLNV